jgi:hypothetical protein
VDKDKSMSDDELEMEDYGSPATDAGKMSRGKSGSSGRGKGKSVSAKQEDKGKYSGGTTGVRKGSSEGEEFGEFDRTGTGTDLTIEMENADVRSGLVKGGEEGADDVAGPAQYGGEAGSLNRRSEPF